MAKTVTSINRNIIHGFTLLHEQTNHGNSDTSYTGLYQLVGTQTKVRISIRANSYTFQSAAKAEMWTPQGWSFVWQIDPEQVEAKRVHNARNGAPEVVMFLVDIEKLLRASSLVLECP